MQSSETEQFINDTVENYSDMMFRVAYNITCNREDAFDVCQDVFMKLMKNKNKIQSDAHLKAWLIRVTVNCAKNFKGQAYNRYTVPIDDLNGAEHDNLDDKLVITSCVQKLSEKYKTIIYLYYYENMSISEIACLLGINENTVKTRLARGRENLRTILEKENYYG